jgi:hypothetical protein
MNISNTKTIITHTHIYKLHHLDSNCKIFYYQVLLFIILVDTNLYKRYNNQFAMGRCYQTNSLFSFLILFCTHFLKLIYKAIMLRNKNKCNYYLYIYITICFVLYLSHQSTISPLLTGLNVYLQR